MKPVRFITPATLSLALSLGTTAVSAEPCTTSADCPLSYTCEVTSVACYGGAGGWASGGAAGAGAMAPTAGSPSGGAALGGASTGAAPSEDVACVPYEYSECVPQPCQSDLECSEGWFCESWEEGYWSGPPEDASLGGRFVVTGNGSQCSPQWADPCQSAADCGLGFDCVPNEICECWGTAGATGSGGTGTGGAAGGYAGAAGSPAALGGASFAPLGGAGSGACPAGLVQCGALCVDVATDPSNCGMCGLVCAPGSVCGEGMCLTSGLGGSGGAAGCECYPTGSGSCQVKDMECVTDRDCPAFFHCYEMGAGGGWCGTNPDGSWSCETSETESRCVPPSYSSGVAGAAGSSGGWGGVIVGGAPGGLAGSAGSAPQQAGGAIGVGAAAGRTGGVAGAGATPAMPLAGRAGSSGASGNAAAGESLSRGGCQMSPSPNPSLAGLLLGLAACFGLIRRRR